MHTFIPASSTETITVVLSDGDDAAAAEIVCAYTRVYMYMNTYIHTHIYIYTSFVHRNYNSGFKRWR